MPPFLIPGALSLLFLFLLAGAPSPVAAQNGAPRNAADSLRRTQDSILATANKAIRGDSTLLDEYQKIIGVLKARRHYDAELTLAEKMIAANPGSALAYFTYGDAQLDNALPDRAIGTLMKALVVEPRFVRARVTLAEAYMMMKSYDTALAELDTAIAHNPRYAQAHVQRAAVLAQLGRETEAIENYRAVSELLPDSYAHWLKLGRLLLDAGQPEEAIEALEYASVLNPESSDAHYFHAEALARSGRREEAIQAYNAFWMRFPRDRRALDAERAARELSGQ